MFHCHINQAGPQGASVVHSLNIALFWFASPSPQKEEKHKKYQITKEASIKCFLRRAAWQFLDFYCIFKLEKYQKQHHLLRQKAAES